VFLPPNSDPSGTIFSRATVCRLVLLSLEVLLLAEIEGQANIQAVRPSLDATYTKQRAKAASDANAEKYYTEVDQTGVMRQDALNAKINITAVERHKKLAKEEFQGRKEDLEGELFTMFKKKDHWVIKDVQVCFFS
jgi:hypothetical protein